MKKTNEIKVTGKESKKALDFMSGLHSSILKAKDKVIRFLQRKGFDEMADTLGGMSQGDFSRFVASKVHEQKLRKQIRAILSELLEK